MTMQALVDAIKTEGLALGFQAVGISDIDLSQHEAHLQTWLDKGFQGDMAWMASHGTKRSRPSELVPGTLRVISVRLDYLPPARDALALLREPAQAYLSRYALGRDYHKLMRKRLQKLADFILANRPETHSRAFVDSAPVLEKALAENAGLGWIGKHTVLLNRHAGSWFFLGELFTNLPLPTDSPVSRHCGSCSACLDICPTQAIVAPYELDARRCISYLTIELKGVIPEDLRRPMGNRVFGCDDCQLVCPWNRYARVTREPDFHPRHGLDDTSLLGLFAWDEPTYLARTEGSALRRLGYERWRRNLAVGLGNAPASHEIVKRLQNCLPECSELVQVHVMWAIEEQQAKLAGAR